MCRREGTTAILGSLQHGQFLRKLVVPENSVYGSAYLMQWNVSSLKNQIQQVIMNTALRILFSGLRHAKGGSLKTNDEKSYYLGFFCILKKKISSTTLFAVASWFNNRSASVAQGLVTYPLYSVV